MINAARPNVYRMKQKAVAAFVLLILCCLPVASQVAEARPVVILVSLDGFRYDYLDRYRPPALTRLAREGVRAKWMIPSFPTKTFPNHYTIATGLYPEHHGIVENNVYDFGEVFRIDDKKQVQDPRWWFGEPIWVTAQKQGLISASYFFVGSEAPIDGVRPMFWRTYNGDVPPQMRVDKALSWLDLPEATRPNLIALYFSDTDDAGHAFGPESEETRYAVLNADSYVARLISGLRARRIENKVNIIVVSDHGMATRDQRNAVVMDDYFDTKDKELTERILTTNEIWQIFPRPGKERLILDGLKPIKHATCWRKADIPARLHYNEGKRVAPIVCSSEEGWAMMSRERFEATKKADDFDQPRGSHGYDNQVQSMRATFIARGPAFKKRYVAEPFENIHVYELMCRILGLKPAKNDGDLKRVRGFLR